MSPVCNFDGWMNTVDCLALFKMLSVHISSMERGFALNENRCGYIKTDVMIKLMCIHYFLILFIMEPRFMWRESVCACVCACVRVCLLESTVTSEHLRDVNGGSKAKELS